MVQKPTDEPRGDVPPATPGARRTFVFLAANASYAHSNLAAWYLQAVAPVDRWRWVTVEATIGDDTGALLERLRREQPDAIGATFYLFNRDFVLAVLRRFKAMQPHVVVIGGGPEFLGDNAAFFAGESAVDVAVRGEGEVAFPQLLACIDEPQRWPAIPGLCGRSEERYFDVGLAPVVEDLGELPSPYGALTAGFAKRFVQIETSRGCANRCAFCTSGGSPSVRLFPLERVRSDLALIRDWGIRAVRVVDRTFNANQARCLVLLHLFRCEFPEIRFHLEIAPALLTEPVLGELAAAGPGQFRLELGIQTLDGEVARRVTRGGSVRRALAGLRRACAETRCATHADLIAGLPGGRLDDVVRDVDALVMCRPGEIQLELLKLLPGTQLAADRERWGLVASAQPPYEVLQTPDMSFEDLMTARRLSYVLDHFYNPPPLQPAALAASAAIPGFWMALARVVFEHSGWVSGLSLESRFRLLDGFLAGRCLAAQHRLQYDWLKYGLGADNGLCPVTAWKAPLPADAELMEGNPQARFRRLLRADLDRTYLFAYGAGDNPRQACAVFSLPRPTGD